MMDEYGGLSIYSGSSDECKPEVWSGHSLELAS